MIEHIADKLIILVSSTLLLCYLGSVFYTKTKIPDIIWVMAFGMLLGPVLGYFDRDLFLSISPMMSTIALSIILFDAGINVDITTLLKAMAKSTGLAIASFISIVVAVGLTLNFLMPNSFTVLQAMLLGSMVGGTSTIAIFGIISGIEKLIPNTESTRVILMMESVISDPICIIVAITIIRMIMYPSVSLFDGLKDILYIFSISSIFGLIVGLIWAEVLNIMRTRSLSYLMTLAILFPCYLIAERIIGEGGGPMAALVFGLMLTNYKYVFRSIGVTRSLKVDKQRLREFHEELTFFIKAFFFVYIGLIVTISIEYLKIGMVVVLIILIMRFVVATTVGRAMSFSREEMVLTRLIFAQGLPAFVMSQLPMILDPERQHFLNPEIYPNLCMPIVLGTVLIAAILGPMIAKKELL